MGQDQLNQERAELFNLFLVPPLFREPYARPVMRVGIASFLQERQLSANTRDDGLRPIRRWLPAVPRPRRNRNDGDEVDIQSRITKMDAKRTRLHREILSLLLRVDSADKFQD